MKVLNFGSINIDHVYRVDHFVGPGETLPSDSYQRLPGGKGFNQTVALARAGTAVSHAGRIGTDGTWLRDYLDTLNVNTTHLNVSEDIPTGHAVVQVGSTGENAILLHGGANHCITEDDVDKVLQDITGDGDTLLLQNEISAMPHLIRSAADRGLQIVLNPAPMTRAVRDYPLEHVAVLILNQVECEQLTGRSDDTAIDALAQRCPQALILQTLGKQGVRCRQGAETIAVPAIDAEVVDTTGAGDTFTGFFIAEWIRSGDVPKALRLGCRAAAMCVSRPGAAVSIPTLDELGR